MKKPDITVMATALSDPLTANNGLKLVRFQLSTI
jgi:hypothetical protein